jgi:hypothetical protein
MLAGINRPHLEIGILIVGQPVKVSFIGKSGHTKEFMACNLDRQKSTV